MTTHEKNAVKILNEAKRVIKETGFVILFEVTKEDSNFVSTLIREATTLMNFSNQDSSWLFPTDMPKRSKLVDEWIKKSNLSIIEEFPDVISSIFVMK